MKKNSITKNYIYNLIYQLFLIIIPLFTTPYLTRVLGAEKLGIYSYTYSIVTILFLIAAIGINTYGQREIAYHQDNKKKRSIIFIELMIIRTFSTVFSLLLLILFSLLASRYSIYYQIFSIYIIANLFDITWYYQGVENFKSIAIKNIIVKFFYFISIFLFIKTKKDLGIYILLFSLSTLITNLSFWLKINKQIELPKKQEINPKRHLKYVITFFIPQVASLIYSVLDATMIGLLDSDIKNVSYYEQASYIVKTTLVIITTMGSVMISKVSYAFSKNQKEKIVEYLEEIIHFVWLIGCALAFGIAAIINNFVPWYYGIKYLKVIPIVYVLCPLIIIIGLNNVIGIQYLIPTKKQNTYVLAVVSGAIFNFIFNFILIKKISALGAAVASVGAELFILLIELYFVKKEIPNLKMMKHSKKYLLFGILMFLITYQIGKFLPQNILGSLIQILIGSIIYLSLLIISKDQFITEHIIPYTKNIFKRRNR